MRRLIQRNASSLLGTLGIVTSMAACADGPVAPAISPDPAMLTTLFECTADMRTRETSCRVPSAREGAGSPLLDIIVGNPYVSVSTSGTMISNGDPANTDTMTVTFTLQNNIPQPMGTTDGMTPHANGTRLFFMSGPTATASNSTTPLRYLSVTADNSLGPASFTSAQGTSWSNRRFYQFDGVLAQGQTNSTFVRFVYDPRVTAFSYRLLVAAPVQYEHGWITVAPGTVPVLAPDSPVTLSAAVYNHLGEIQADGLAWSSSDPTVATVDASGVVTAVGQGTATITATSTVNAQRTGSRVITVDAVPGVASTTPANEATHVYPGDNIVITFSEPVNVSTNSFTIHCSGGRVFTLSGSGTSTITLNPNSPLPTSDTCTVTVLAAQVSDVDANDGPNHLAADYVFSFQTDNEIVIDL